MFWIKRIMPLNKWFIEILEKDELNARDPVSAFLITIGIIVAIIVIVIAISWFINI